MKVPKTVRDEDNRVAVLQMILAGHNVGIPRSQVVAAVPPKHVTP